MGRKHRVKREPALADFGAPELRQHHAVVVEGTAEPRARVSDQHVLDRYWLRGELEAKQNIRDEKCQDRLRQRTVGALRPEDDGDNGRRYLAGVRFLADCEAAGGRPRPMVRPYRVSGGLRFPEAPAAALEARNRALPHLGLLVGVVQYVVVESGSAGDWASARGEERRFGLSALRLALDALAKHYGI
jgi:hypothetical protein